MCKVIIAGSRDITNYHAVCAAVAKSGFREIISEIVSGHARGVDQLGEKFAKEHKIPMRIFPADWDTYGKSAGHRRNREMGDYADILIALWDGKSRGTKGMIDYMYSLDKRVYIHHE